MQGGSKITNMTFTFVTKVMKVMSYHMAHSTSLPFKLSSHSTGPKFRTICVEVLWAPFSYSVSSRKRKTQTLRFQGKCEMQQILYFK